MFWFLLAYFDPFFDDFDSIEAPNDNVFLTVTENQISLAESRNSLYFTWRSLKARRT